MLQANGSKELAGAAILANAVTGEPVAEIDSTGVDFAGMLDYARRVGGPALRKLTFHQRALRLKALATYLMERKEEFYELSKATGATRTDAWIDVEGGIGTLFAYASKGRRELPEQPHSISMARRRHCRGAAASSGQHICVPLEGAAVHINAFNFPGWGMLEKMAPTLLAGMPADRQAGEPDGLRDRADVPPDGRVRHLSRGLAAADLRRAPATCSTT